MSEYFCQLRRNISPLGRSKISPHFCATRGVAGCPGSPQVGPTRAGESAEHADEAGRVGKPNACVADADRIAVDDLGNIAQRRRNYFFV